MRCIRLCGWPKKRQTEMMGKKVVDGFRHPEIFLNGQIMRFSRRTVFTGMISAAPGREQRYFWLLRWQMLCGSTEIFWRKRSRRRGKRGCSRWQNILRPMRGLSTTTSIILFLTHWRSMRAVWCWEKRSFRKKLRNWRRLPWDRRRRMGFWLAKAFHGPKEASGAAVLWILDIMWKKRFRVSSFMAD